MSVFQLKLAGVTLPCLTRFNETIGYFSEFGEPFLITSDSLGREWIEEDSTEKSTSAQLDDSFANPQMKTNREKGCADMIESSFVQVTELDWKDCETDGFFPSAPAEASLLTANISDALLHFNRVIIHAVAVRWHGAAYLICAHSGTGKSTQARFLQELCPGEFSVICGDRPVLEFQTVETILQRKNHADLPLSDIAAAAPIIVHPSPWNGKENWHGGEAAPLAGLILLKRGEKNSIAPMSKNNAALPLYSQFIQTAWETDNIRKIAALETRLLNSVPLWELTTNTVPDSTKLLLKEVFL